LNSQRQGVRLQWLTTRWTKKSRGNPGATRRAALPRSLLFPLVEGEPERCLHRVNYPESLDFAPSGETLVYEPSDEDIERDLSLRLLWEGPVLQVLYLGIPVGWSQPVKKVFELRPGQWGQMVDSWRVPYEDTWGYVERVVNVRNGPAVDGRAFVGKPHGLADKRNWLR
jgi:hypothetical protein